MEQVFTRTITSRGSPRQVPSTAPCGLVGMRFMAVTAKMAGTPFSIPRNATWLGWASKPATMG